MGNAIEDIESTIKSHKIVLFMKGTKLFPQCGFSARIVGMLKELGAEYKDVNVLADPALREGIKEYSHWPTIPQLYIDGKFIGGCDIATELFQTGELKKLIEPA